MKNLRRHGKAPYKIVVVHGGPGAPGTMAPVARELSPDWGVLEPLQTKASLEGQVQELKDVIEENGDIPVTLVGSSWGAMLSFIVSARYPALIKKVILIGSAVYEQKYSPQIMETRLNRLSKEERMEALSLMKMMDDPLVQDKNTLMARFGELLTRIDAYDPFTTDIEVLECQYNIHTKVWKEAKELRINGKLLELGKQIQCPVVAIHGDYDPHPPEGVKRPLSSVLANFRFILLENCGHLPWIEKQARKTFYQILKEEL